jgi:4-hydroxyacetophenone monooxygenase
MADATRSFTTRPFIPKIEQNTEPEDEVRTILAEVEWPPLLTSLAYATGDLLLLKDHLRPDPLLFATPQGGLTEEQRTEIRELALQKLVACRDGGCIPARVPSDADVQRIMELAVGGAKMGAYFPLLEGGARPPRP